MSFAPESRDGLFDVGAHLQLPKMNHAKLRKRWICDVATTVDMRIVNQNIRGVPITTRKRLRGSLESRNPEGQWTLLRSGACLMVLGIDRKSTCPKATQ